MKNQFLRFQLKYVTILFFPLLTWAQFPPPAGQNGSTAIFRDSTIIINWAKTCFVHPGYVNIADTSIYSAGSNKANYGVGSDVLGKADENVVSLGDGGIATLTFDPPISNGDGFDFAVFENGLSDSFLELAFVEVSSDGTRFVRFSSTSLTPEISQIATFGSLDATKINNLAGKYRQSFGTPFDLEELKDSSGLDLMHITHVRIIDVVGSMITAYASFDSFGHKINDPWPTPFNTGGFDLDAAGVFHEGPQIISKTVLVYPNPFQSQLHIIMPVGTKATFYLINCLGKVITSENLTSSNIMDFNTINSGLYMGRFIFSDGRMEIHKIIKQ